VATNNVAEYTAVIDALDIVQEYLEEAKGEVKGVQFFLDSELVVRQLNGIYRVKDVTLQDLWIRVQSRARQLGVSCTFHHVRRENNKDADRLVNQALDAEQAAGVSISK
jgi:ribonuclease HI